MKRESHDSLLTIVADTENLQQQLRELHASVKAKSGERRDRTDQPAGVGMVIKGK